MEKEKALETRRETKKKKPDFKRHEYFRKRSLGSKWRRPRGINSKVAARKRSRIGPPSPGYGSPLQVKGLDRDGYREMLVHNLDEIKRIDPKEEVAVIASGVGKKKMLEMLEFAVGKDIRVKGHGVI